MTYRFAYVGFALVAALLSATIAAALAQDAPIDAASLNAGTITDVELGNRVIG